MRFMLSLSMFIDLSGGSVDIFLCDLNQFNFWANRLVDFSGNVLFGCREKNFSQNCVNKNEHGHY